MVLWPRSIAATRFRAGDGVYALWVLPQQYDSPVRR